MKERIDEEIVRYLWWLRPVLERRGARRRRPARRRADGRRSSLNNPAEPSRSAAFGGAAPRAPAPGRRRQRRRDRQPARVGGDDAPVKTVRRDEPKVGRNDPCPCGSGKKYKKCHGRGTLSRWRHMELETGPSTLAIGSRPAWPPP